MISVSAAEASSKEARQAASSLRMSHISVGTERARMLMEPIVSAESARMEGLYASADA